ncbi:MAG: hypothetical protein KatS3mg085_640 [Candidatus Dojkabacteria bacterium]|nr:MAG: hypothetical protein KatS3mg085_640 [Candidatus Dojkabacteria bacterium]
MKTLIISDTHLGKAFSKQKYVVLKNLFEDADRIIINGDFWDDGKTTFQKFIKSQWKGLLSTFEKKEVIYILGNHDEETPKNAEKILHVKILNQYKLKVGKKTLYITHGHNVVRYLNSFHSFVVKYKLLRKIMSKFISFIIYITNKKFIKTFYQKMNNDMKAWAKQNLQKDEILVCGHSHLQELDISNQFINLGANTTGLQQHMLIEGTIITMYDNSKVKYRFKL